MLRRLLRWLLRAIVMVIVLSLIVAISRYISHRYKPGSVLVVELDGPVMERGDSPTLGLLNPHMAALNVVRRALRGAASDPRISGLALKVIDPEMELAQAQELSGMIGEF